MCSALVSCRGSLRTLALTSVLCGCSSLKCLRKSLTGTIRSLSAWWKSTMRHLGEKTRHKLKVGGRIWWWAVSVTAVSTSLQTHTAAYSALLYNCPRVTVKCVCVTDSAGQQLCKNRLDLKSLKPSVRHKQITNHASSSAGPVCLSPCPSLFPSSWVMQLKQMCVGSYSACLCNVNLCPKFIYPSNF